MRLSAFNLYKSLGRVALGRNAVDSVVVVADAAASVVVVAFDDDDDDDDDDDNDIICLFACLRVCVTLFPETCI